MATFTNQAQLSYNNTVVNSNVTVGEIVQVLSASKTAIVDTYGQNDEVTYVVNIVNSGTIPFNNLVITDNLGEYTFDGATTRYPLTYVNGSVYVFTNGILQATPVVTAGPPLTITGISVPAAGNVVVVYKARTNEFAPIEAGGRINNIATISGDTLSTSIEASETITVVNEPILSITKALSPAVITENGSVTYTFVIQNSGNAPATATDNVVIADTFTPALSNISVTYNGTSWTEGVNYTYDETTGEFATVASSIVVPAATYTQDAITGAYTITPGTSTITVTGTI